MFQLSFCGSSSVVVTGRGSIVVVVVVVVVVVIEEDVGTLTTRVPHKSIYGPFQGSVQHLHKPTEWPFSGPQKQPFSGPRSVFPTNHTSVYSDQS